MDCTPETGTDTTWVYLWAARNDTVHVQQVDPSHLLRVDVATRLHISEGLRVPENREDGPDIVVDPSPKPAPPREPDEVHIENNLWAFQPVFNHRTGSAIELPLHDDVVSIREVIQIR
ncbi:MAG TPA: hypothetical protein VEU97_17450 [Ktedonobacteraceae bacterium]|nr:hypothetical protein [Ktedonobacteraceae bacterium]